MAKPARFYDGSLYQFDSAQPSYWEATATDSASHRSVLDSPGNCDIAILGGGYTGLSAAYTLASEYNCDVRVLEAGHIGWGASGRNGGFCTLGGVKLSHKQMIRRFGLEAVTDFWQSQAAAVECVTDLCDSESIEVSRQGDGEYTVADNQKHFSMLEEEADLWRNKFGIHAETLTREQFLEVGYDSMEQQGAMLLKPSYGIHPLKFVFGLAAAAERKGAVLHPHSEVIDWQKKGSKHELHTAGGVLRANKVLVACNGFMPEHLQPQLRSRLVPVQSNIIVTRSLSDAELEAHRWRTECPMVNTRNLFFYFRMLPNNQLMVGARGGTQGSADEADAFFQSMKQRVDAVWPHWQHVDVEYSWRGLIGINSTRCPALGQSVQDPSTYFAFGYQGNGVNTATWSGRQMANWMVGDTNLYGRGKAVPKILLSGTGGNWPRKIRPSFFRRTYLNTMLAKYRLLDSMKIWL